MRRRSALRYLAVAIAALCVPGVALARIRRNVGLVAGGGGGGNVTYENASASAYANATSLSWSHTASGSDRGVVVFVSQYVSNGFDGACTYNGDPMDHVDRMPSDSQATTEEMFALAAPDTGAQTITYTPFGSPTAEMAGAAISMTNCNQTTANMYGTPTQVSTGSTAQTVSSAADELVVSGCYSYNSTDVAPADGGMTERVQTAAGAEIIAMATKTGEASTNIDWSGSGISGSISVGVKPV